ncbi:MAG: GTP 3',8-cyclase MoaA [Limnochordia bacterium]
MIQDGYHRKIDYLRISVTDRCNLRCVYCMPAHGVKPKAHQDILSLEEIYRLAQVAVKLGISKIRITGGEPLVRKNITSLVANLAQIPGLVDLSLTTNGLLLADMAPDLKTGGLKRVNISLDSLKAERYRQLTRIGDLKEAWRGIEAALQVGLDPVKINMVVIQGVNDDELGDFARLTLELPLHIRFIELMPIGGEPVGEYLSSAQIKERLEEEFTLQGVPGPNGAGPARYYQLPQAQGTIGFISPISDHFCQACNRLRLTPDGILRPCLGFDTGIPLRDRLRQGISDGELAELIGQAIAMKPQGHNLTTASPCRRIMSQIGG